MHDVLVLGSGVAGLSAALGAARTGCSVLVLTRGAIADTNTRWAQGGVAAALQTPDTPDLHLADTLVAGAGMCDAAAVHVLVREGPDRVRELAALGAHFDETPEGTWALAREGGHSLARVVHAGGDATGAEIERALIAAVAASDIEVREGWAVIELLVEQGRCTGVIALDPSGLAVNVRALDTVLATGGNGQCFAVTTNPAGATGSGVALALRAGVACADLEFVQFHPTALHVPTMPRPLLSEALRGEGAVLRDDDGNEFMSVVHPQRDLAPRDVVSRAIAQRMHETGTDHVWLDASTIRDFATRFPTIWQHCRDHGLDPTVDWLPVAPAAHYLCGGVVTDLDGATTLAHLWACGEVACSGVHGANRLASNSLLDGLVFGNRVVQAIARGRSGPEATGVMASVLPVVPEPVEPPPSPFDPTLEPVDTDALRASVQRVMATDAGVVRDAAGLSLAAATLGDLAGLVPALPARAVASYTVVDLLTVARATVAAAALRTESRGAHTRSDHPDDVPGLLGRFVSTGLGAPQFVPFGTGRAPQGRRRR